MLLYYLVIYNNIMSTTKQITIYEPAEKSHKLSALSVTKYDNIESYRIRELYYNNFLLKSHIPSIFIKNILHGVIPIINDDENAYKIYLQEYIPIITINVKKKIKIYAAGQIVPISGFYFDGKKTSSHFTRFIGNLTNNSRDDRMLLGDINIRTMDYTWNHSPSPRICADLNIPENELPSCKGSMYTFSDDDDAIAKIESVIISMNSIKKYAEARGVNQPAYTIIQDNADSYVVKDKIINIITHNDDWALNNFIKAGFNFDTCRPKSVLEAADLIDLYYHMTINKVNSMEEFISEARIRKISLNQLNVSKIENSRNAWLDNISMSEFRLKFKFLTERQMEIVKNKYKYEYDLAEGTRCNSCKHLKIKRNVMTSKGNIFNKEEWEELKKYAPLDIFPEKKKGVVVIPDYTNGISCRVCNLWCICPHHYHIFDFIDTMFDGDEDKMIESLLINFSKDVQDLDDSYYCKICNELLKKNIVEGEIWSMKISSGSINNDETMKNIHSVVSNFVINNVNFNNLIINKKSIINGIAENIDKYVRQYELKINMIKTMTENIKNNSVIFIINIYTITSIIHLSIVYGGEISLKGAIIKDMKESDMLYKLFNVAYKLITSQNKTTIANNPAFTPDRIKKLFTHSYKQVSGSVIEIEEERVVGLWNPLINNPVYDFIYLGWVLSDLTRGKKRKNPIADLNRIMGIDKLEDFLKVKMIFDKANMPPAWKDIPIYFWDSYSTVAKRLLTNTFLYDKINTNKINEELNKINKRKKDMEKEESAKYNLRINIPDKWSKWTFVPDSDDKVLSYIFCNNAKYHKWDIYVYKNEEKMVEVKIGEFGKISLQGYKFIHRKCSLCNDIFGAAPKSNLLKNINHSDKIKSFYMYYQNECPVHFRHVYENEKCVNCGIDNKILSSYDETYFSKYENIYDDRNKETNKEDDTSPFIVSSSKSFIAKKYMKWEFNMANISNMSKIMDIPYNVLVNIGITERYNFTDIESGKINPSHKSTESELVFQRDNITRHIIHLYLTYNRFTSCVDMIYPELADICVSRYNEVRSLKTLDLSDFYDEYDYRINNESVQLNINWCLNYLFSFILNFYKSEDNLKSKFIDIFVKILIKTESDMGKHLPTRREVKQAHKEENALSVSDTMAKSILNVGDDGDDDEGETKDQFSLASIDVDSYAESMGQD
jgi:hypothetical protein